MAMAMGKIADLPKTSHRNTQVKSGSRLETGTAASPFEQKLEYQVIQTIYVLAFCVCVCACVCVCVCVRSVCA